MSWLNFNDSLSTLKGQISNFANTVLAEDVLENRSESDSIENKTECDNEARSNAFNTEDPWTWSSVESKTDQLKTDETITNLKKRIEDLQNENRDLITSLDQLDQNHLQNAEQLMKLKSKLSEELEIVAEKYEKLNMKYNKLALAENGYKKKINEMKNKYDELKQERMSNTPKENGDILERNRCLEKENAELKEKLAKTKNEISSVDESGPINPSIIELEMENKALKIALQTTKELQTSKEDTKIKEFEEEIARLKCELQQYEKGKLFKETSPSDFSSDSSHKFVQSDSPERECKNADLIEGRHAVIKELEKQLRELKKEKDEETSDYLEQLKLGQSENDEVKKELSEAEKKNADLIEGCQAVIEELEKQLHELKTAKDEETSNYLEQLKLRQSEVDEVKKELSEAKKENVDLEKNYYDLQEINRELKNYNVENEKDMKDKYERQISDLMFELSSIKKQAESQTRSNNENEKQWFDIVSKHFKEYSEKEDVQNDFEILIELISNRIESKVSELQKELQAVNQNRNHLQNEKNDEINKLTLKNEILEQQLSRRSKELADAEDECSQLMKNNDLLISKLEDLKQNGLQTIFESNEDNVASLEKQLETSFKRIEELEATVSDKTRIDNEVDENVQSLSVKEKDILESTIEDLKNKLQSTENERDNCRALIDKMRLDYETTEYQFSEMNVNLETLSEEIEKHKMRIDLLVSENENLKSLKEVMSESNEELELTKQELRLARENYLNLEKKIKEIEQKYEGEVYGLKNENDTIRHQFKEMTLKKSELEKEVEEKEGDINKLQETIHLIKLRNIELSDTYDSICNVLAAPDEDTSGHEFDISRIIDSIGTMKERLNALEVEKGNLTLELNSLKTKTSETGSEDLQNLITSRNELITIVQTKHQETLTYHAEIQRLSEILKKETEKNIEMEKEIENMKHNFCPVDKLIGKDEEIEKLNDQIIFLRQKCDVLAQSMLDEQQRLENEKLTSSERETALSKKMDRLQNHLVEVEEHYTQELLQSEQEKASLQARLNEVEKREKDSSNIYTSVSIRANQQNEALTQQLQSMTSQRDEFRKKMLDLEDENNVKAAALTNLQLVLEQFQRDKDADVVRETERIRRQIKQEQKIQEDLRKEIETLENQIKESKEGLRAALRLTDQLEMSKNQVSVLKEEVSVLTDKLRSKEEELQTATSQTDGKVDKSLIKNLIIGFVTSNKNMNKDQKQILKIIATVLDFNEQDHNKVNLNQAQQNTWLSSLLSPMADDVPPNESLSRAFVNFLENESKPRVIPSLIHQGGTIESSSTSASSTRTTPTPIVLNEIVLPTFSDFPQQRNSSSILKGVLKDNP